MCKVLCEDSNCKNILLRNLENEYETSRPNVHKNVYS